jgi:CLIP-associating protein 1/2
MFVVLDKASPLRTNGPSPASSIREDVEMLVSGQPELRNLQKLALFATSHPISSDGIDDLDDEDDKRIWEEDKLFDRVFQGLADFLEPSRVCPSLLACGFEADC